MIEQTYKRKYTKHFSAFRLLITTAEDALEAAEEQDREGRYFINYEVVAMTFSALALEALCNVIGSLLELPFDKYEKQPVIKKLKQISKALNIENHSNQDLWETAKWLVEFRNNIAHSKPENLTSVVMLTKTEYKSRNFDCPESDLEKLITVKNAKRSVLFVKELEILLSASLEDSDEAFGLLHGGWGAETTPHQANRNEANTVNPPMIKVLGI